MAKTVGQLYIDNPLGPLAGTEMLELETALGVSGAALLSVLATYVLTTPFATKTVATAGSPTTAGKMLFISDESGGAVMAFSDGTNWRRTTDRAIIS